MIHLSTPLFDPQGAIALDELPSSDLGSVSRRVNRVATLDGGSVSNDRGHTASDRTFRISWRIRSRDEYDAVQRLLQVHGRVRIATREGVFEGVPDELSKSDGEGDLTILIMEQLA